jgi:hypothetical protein
MDKSEKQLISCMILVLIGGIALQYSSYKLLKEKYNQ